MAEPVYCDTCGRRGTDGMDGKSCTSCNNGTWRIVPSTSLVPILTEGVRVALMNFIDPMDELVFEGDTERITKVFDLYCELRSAMGKEAVEKLRDAVRLSALESL